MTTRTWPPSWLCQCVRAPGANETLLIVTPSVSASTGSPHTVPVNVAVRSSDGAPARPPFIT